MVTCIVASTFGLVFTIISSIGLGVSSHGPYRYNSDHSHSSVAGLYGFQVSKEIRINLVSTGSLITSLKGFWGWVSGFGSCSKVLTKRGEIKLKFESLRIDTG